MPSAPGACAKPAGAAGLSPTGSVSAGVVSAGVVSVGVVTSSAFGNTASSNTDVPYALAFQLNSVTTTLTY